MPVLTCRWKTPAAYGARRVMSGPAYLRVRPEADRPFVRGGMTGMTRAPVLPEATPVGPLSAQSGPPTARVRLSFELSEGGRGCGAGNAHRPFRSEFSLDKIRNSAIEFSFTESSAVCQTRAEEQ